LLRCPWHGDSGPPSSRLQCCSAERACEWGMSSAIRPPASFVIRHASSVPARASRTAAAPARPQDQPAGKPVRTGLAPDRPAAPVASQLQPASQPKPYPYTPSGTQRRMLQLLLPRGPEGISASSQQECAPQGSPNPPRTTASHGICPSLGAQGPLEGTVPAAYGKRRLPSLQRRNTKALASPPFACVCATFTTLPHHACCAASAAGTSRPREALQ
jgi:hypothetical protein